MPDRDERGPLLSLDLPADPDAPSQARHRVRAVAAAYRVNLASLELALSEAVTNAVVHAYRFRDEPGRIGVTVAAEEDMLVVAVSDDGDGMVPRPDSPGIGAGLPIIATLCDVLDVQQMARGTRLVMRFALG